MKRILLLGAALFAAGTFAAPALPAGCGYTDPAAAMSLDDAWCVKTDARERYALNGLWQCHDAQHPGKTAWSTLPDTTQGSAHRIYRRTFRTPASAAGKRVLVTFSYAATLIVVRVDGRETGCCYFPGGEVDVTAAVRPGEMQTYEVDVSCYSSMADILRDKPPERDPTAGKPHHYGCGVTGDFWLDILPQGARLIDPWAECSHEKGAITFKAESENLPAAGVRLVADVVGCGEKKQFVSDIVKADTNGVVAFTAAWPDAKRWDFHTTSNLYSCTLSMRDAAGRTLDAVTPFRFGFREVRACGNRIMLNGSPVHLRFLLAGVVCQGYGKGAEENAADTCRRLRGEGYNALTDNYGVAPGSYTYLEGAYRACDAAGVAYFHTLPHISAFGGVAFFTNVTEQARYRKVAKQLVKLARNHPCVFAYALNHNAVGYATDIDPMKIDGAYMPTQGPMKTRKAAHRAAEIVRELDATRLCYHHEGGNLDDMVASNVYLDWAPRQERSEWVAHWATNGVKPLFFVEWGMPHVANWSSFRGPAFIWYNPLFQSAVPAEAAAAFRGDAAFEDTPAAHGVLRHEEELWAKKEPWYWRDSQHTDTFVLTNNLHGIQAWFMADNLRCFRAWGLSAILPWDQRRTMFDRVRPGKVVKTPNRYEGLKRPGGMKADTYRPENEYIVDHGDPAEWVRTVAGECVARWNQDNCCFIGGAGIFTDKRHIFRPGDTAAKTLVFVNDNRVPTTYRWEIALADAAGKTVETRRGETTVPPGERGETPVAFRLPTAGDWKLSARFEAPGWTGSDDFALTAVAPDASKLNGTVNLYDPKGLTAAHFRRLGIPFNTLKTVADVRAHKHNLVIGRESLTAEVLDAILSDSYNYGSALIFEQTQQTLEALGFRVQEYGLRETYPRYTDAAVPLRAETLRDWTGSSTLVPGYRPSCDDQHYPSTIWAGYRANRVFRCGNRGAVATVMLEKPTRGDWRPLVDGGWDLQYTPLVDWRCDFARVTFCQCDVTARTEPCPAADDLTRRLVARLVFSTRNQEAHWCKAYGAAAWKAVLANNSGMLQEVERPGRLTYVVSSGAKKPDWLDAKVKNEGARVLCAGLNAAETRAWAPVHVDVEDVKGRYFTRLPAIDPVLNGCSNAEMAWHGAMDFAAFTYPSPTGNPALRVVRYGKGYYVFMQVAPWMVDDVAKPYLRPTKRRTWFLFNRILGNMGIASRDLRPRYADAPEYEDDPYRFYRW